MDNHHKRYRMTGSPTRRSFLCTTGLAAVCLAGCTGFRGLTEPSPAPDPGTSGPAADRDGEADNEATATFRVDIRNRGYVPESIPMAVYRAWTVPGINVGDHTAAKASAVRDPEGNYVIPGDTGDVHSIAPDGTINWVAATHPSANGIHGTPMLANGLVYIGAYDGALYAFDRGSGELVWRTKLGGSIGASPTYHEGIVYIAVEYPDPDGAVFGVDSLTGEVRWEDRWPSDHPHSTVAIDPDSGYLVFGANDGNLYAWTFPDLNRAWTFETQKSIKGPVALYDSAAFFGSWDSNIYRVDLATGQRDWAFETNGYVMGGAGVDPDAGVIYMGGHDGWLRALDAATGEQYWRYDAGGRLIGSAIVTANHVLVGSYDGHLHAVRKATGGRRWRTSGRAGTVSCEPLIDDRGIVFTSRATDDTSGKAVKVVGL